MSTFTTNVFIREQYFLAGNVQVVKFIANRRIYRCNFCAMVRVWYAFSETRIFTTDRQTGARRERKGKQERERQNKKYERSTSFLRGSSWVAVDNFGRHLTEIVKRFSITIAVTMSTEKEISRDNRIPLDFGIVLHFRIEDRLDYIFKLIRTRKRKMFKLLFNWKNFLRPSCDNK